jgi:hypothetical protein
MTTTELQEVREQFVLNLKKALDAAQATTNVIDAPTIEALFTPYDNAIERALNYEQMATEIGTAIAAFQTVAMALNGITHDHLRRRVHKALGVLMLEPTPSPLEKLADALPEMVRMLGPILAQGTGPVVETTEEPDAYADGMVVPHTGAPSGFGIYFGHTVHDLEQWLAAQKAAKAP